MAVTPYEILSNFQNITSILNADYVLLQSASGNTTVKITAELFRAYLTDGLAVSVDENGFLVIGGQQQGIQFGTAIRRGMTGLETSTDGGTTWTELVSFTDIVNLGVEVLTEQMYEDKVANGQIDENKLYYTYEE